MFGAAFVLALSLAHPQPASVQPPPHGMSIATPQSVEVLIARRTDDGSLETACVDNDDAAKAFFSRTTKTKAATKPEEK